jgi:hypothetical protein
MNVYLPKKDNCLSYTGNVLTLGSFFFQDRESKKYSNDEECESVFCMDSIANNGSGGNGNDRMGTRVLPMDNITYSWRNINVYASGLQIRRRGIWCRRRGGSTADQQGKHILQDGDLSYSCPLIGVTGI